LVDATTQPRPFRPDGIPLWHGSASSEESTELAARFGDPLFSANGFHPLEKYAGLIRHYRERWEAYGHDPADAVVGAGFNGLYVKKSSQDAVEGYRPIFDAFMDSPGAKHNKLPFTTLEEFLEQGSVLVGSPEQVIDKFGRYQEAFGHELSGVSLEIPGLPEAESRASVETFVTDVMPVLRSSYPSRVWV
jgi:alkanesulfonate monooxygenase SsuD/methylene tetrahydromethanopterin reductase-like flavin-dependent oxidoreductase (luciferase family)